MWFIFREELKSLPCYDKSPSDSDVKMRMTLCCVLCERSFKRRVPQLHDLSQNATRSNPPFLEEVAMTEHKPVV